HGRTGEQVYRGLAGLFIIHDGEEKGIGLPTDQFDLPVIIQDRSFDNENQFSYLDNGMMEQVTGFLGDQILVNGSVDRNISAGNCAYRLRILNGSNSRIYKLAWEDGASLTVIGTDGGLLEKPKQLNYVVLAPAQRVDLWVDFSSMKMGELKRLINLPYNALGGETAFSILTVNVSKEVDNSEKLPDKLSTIVWHKSENAANHNSPRSFKLQMARGMNWTLNGRLFDKEKVVDNEVVKLGDLEIWEFENSPSSGMGMMGGLNLPHPMHVHGLQFQVIQRDHTFLAPDLWESFKDGIIDEGWHDTVLVLPGEKVSILLRFQDYTGLYLYHCHNLEHEDMGMMRNYLVNA
ncbi:MAG: multicopper oxidase domain-containing protein, partial [Anaerolineae bacterium]|nr:multicopper oxidase domain-containing protein [Anaerolineae bacterium]